MKNDDLKDPKKRENDAPKGDGSGADSEHANRLRLAKEQADEAGRQIARQIGNDGKTSRKELSKIVGAFRSALLPQRRVGRKPSAEITAAYQDWVAGMPAQQLRRTHIRNYARLAGWRRDKKVRALMAALRARRRRDSNRLAVPTKCN
jgi:hypothetical protein